MNFTEKEVTIQSKVALKGTLGIPIKRSEKAAAVLIIPGTGKLDRNGKVNTKLDLKLYRQLAEFLSGIGFITLRYDKRGVGASEGDYYSTGMWDLVDDARACVQYLKNLPEVDPEKVILLGHSEGSMLGTAVAAREELGGAILLAGAVETLEGALKRQRDSAREDVRNTKGLLGFYFRLINVENRIEKAAQKMIDKVLKSDQDVMRVSFVKTNAKWMREHFAYNPKEDLPKITCPVLAITGARDYQADPEVLKQLSEYVKSESEYHVIENMGHSMKFQPRTSNMYTVKKDIIAESKLPVHPELLQCLEAWLSKHIVENKKDQLVTI